MSLRDSLVALVNAAPPDGTVPVRWIGELLATEGQMAEGDKPTGDALVDLTVSDVAARFGKGESTVRTWLAHGDLPGAYRLHGREWRIPLASVEAMQREQAKQHLPPLAAPPRAGRPVDLGAWRKHVPSGDSPRRAS